MSALQIFLPIVIAFIVVLPPKYDPAIRWKERNERKRKEVERDR